MASLGMGSFVEEVPFSVELEKKALTDLKSVGAHNDDKQFEHHIGRDMIRYDTRCFFDVQSTADMSQFNLPRGTNN